MKSRWTMVVAIRIVKQIVTEGRVESEMTAWLFTWTALEGMVGHLLRQGPLEGTLEKR